VLTNPGSEFLLCTKSVDVPELALLYEVWITMLLVPSHVKPESKGIFKLAGKPVVGTAKVAAALTVVRPVWNELPFNTVAAVFPTATLKEDKLPENVVPTA
jgi:hypothetical protein